MRVVIAQKQKVARTRWKSYVSGVMDGKWKSYVMDDQVEIVRYGWQVTELTLMAVDELVQIRTMTS